MREFTTLCARLGIVHMDEANVVVVCEVTMWLLSLLERVLKPVVSPPHVFVKAGTNFVTGKELSE